MRSRPDPHLLLVAILALAAPTLHAGEALTPQEVQRAVDTVKADPQLATEKTVRRLAWDDEPDKKEAKPKEPSRLPKWLSWIGDLFGWIAQTSQMLFWLLIGTLVAVLVVLVVRLFATRGGGVKGRGFVAPTHVQDMDIRPESLPDDIGAAARQLWDQGEQRAALALLYRGLLSRLAHVYEVPIRDSSTEGDCLMLAARVIEPHRIEYATRLVRTWQRAIYGGLSIDSAVVHELCAGFDQHLGRPAAAEEPRRNEFRRGAAA